ncbi:hypothetical protein HRG_013264 [Hirsutella rhossiliensis]
MQYDAISVRQYLLQKGYSPQQIDWIETIADATTHYDTYSLSEAVMEQSGTGRLLILLSGVYNNLMEGSVTVKLVTTVRVRASDCDMGRIVDGLVKIISKTVETTKRVTAIKAADNERTYNHVINTVPLGAMQVMDMTELDLDYRKKLAIRRLQYDPAAQLTPNLLLSRRAILLRPPHPPIIEITLRNLAAMHNYVDSHLWNWYEGQDTVGAFAIFGPSEYSSMLPALMMPAAEGKLHFAGEALSSGHAWIIEAVNSAYRTVAEVLAVERMDHKLAEMVDTWGLINEVEMGWYSNVFAQ